jgi:hypothetical protein
MPYKLLSLYDYLGYNAGPLLEEAVAECAKSIKTKYAVRYISNPKHIRPVVVLYTKEFLDYYFKGIEYSDNNDYTEINTQLMEDSYKESEIKNQN